MIEEFCEVRRGEGSMADDAVAWIDVENVLEMNEVLQCQVGERLG